MTASLALTLPAQLSDSDRAALADILLLAGDHSATVREKRRELEAAIKLGHDHDDELLAYDMAITGLAAAISTAALLRTAIIGPLDDTTGAILNLADRSSESNLGRFLRPIFVEAGIGEDYRR